jgi:hypothetical protein
MREECENVARTGFKHGSNPKANGHRSCLRCPSLKVSLWTGQGAASASTEFEERSVMKPGLLLFALFTTSPSVLSGQQGGVLEQFLAASQKQSDIFNRAERSFLLEADLTVQLAEPTPGHLRIQWLSRNHWRRELEFGAYKESVIRAGEYEYASRNIGFAPLRTTQLVGLLQFAKGSTGFAPNRMKIRKQGGASLSCIEMVGPKSEERYDLCADPVTHDIASMTPWMYGIEGGNAIFSDYREIEGMRFPGHLELLIGKRSAASISITKLQEQSFDAGLLTAPPGAIERRYCEIMTAPVMIRRPDLSHSGASGAVSRVTFQITILKDGTVGSIQVIGQSSAKAADSIRKDFKDARFKPALCGAEPVVADIEESIEIAY